MDEKPKKKKQSLTKRLRQMKESRDRMVSLYERASDTRDEYYDLIRELEKIVPKKYYIINFYMLSTSNVKVKAQETVLAYNIHHAIKCIKKGKAHPNSFELIDAKIIK